MKGTKSEAHPAGSGVALLVDALDYAFDRRSWHGPNLMGALRGVGATEASRRVAGRKTIWEQALHAAYWKQRVLSKVAGPSRFPRPGSDWPPPPAEPTEAAWRADVDLLGELHRRLRSAVASMPPERLGDRQLIWLIHGAAAHDLYHAGQIRLLRRMTGLVRRRRQGKGARARTLKGS